MKELDCQRMVVDAVRREDGFAMKMAHRFFVGVPDLIVQMKGHSSGLWEVKLNRGRPKTPYYVPVTPAQRKFLVRFAEADGICGALSFYLEVDKLYMLAVPANQLGVGQYPLNYVELIKGRRHVGILDELKRIHSEK